jgi:hypothetical protein
LNQQDEYPAISRIEREPARSSSITREGDLYKVVDVLANGGLLDVFSDWAFNDVTRQLHGCAVMM